MPKEFDAFTRLDASDVNSFLVNNGELRQILYFTSSGTFTKATYPWLNAIRVRVQGAGGGGGGAGTTGASSIQAGGGGTGGSYAESFITDIAGLPDSVTVTRGAGGAGGAAGSNAGAGGGSSSFGTLVIGLGGLNGGTTSFGGAPIWNSGDANGQVGGTGSLVIPGGPSVTGISLSFTAVIGGAGGDSFLGRGANSNKTFVDNQGGNGQAGFGYGSGGGGGLNSQNTATARSGGNGANGIVIVELYA